MDKEPKAPISFSQKIITNIIWNFFGQGLLLVITFFSTPYIVRHLTVNLYGIFAIAGVIIGYFSFLQFGLASASIKYISQYLAQKENNKIAITFWSSLLFSLLMGLLGTGAIALSAGIFVERFLKIPEELKPVALFAIRVGSLGLLISMLLATVMGVLRALERFDIVNYIGITLGVLNIGSIILILKLGFSLKEIIIVTLIIQTMGVYIAWIFVKKLLPFLTKPIWGPSLLIPMFKFGGCVTISGTVSPILMNIEKMFLTMLRPISNLTYYSIPFSIMNALSMIPSAVAGVLFPAFSYFGSSQDKQINKELHYRGSLCIFFSYFFPVVFFIIFSRPFLTLWIGEGFAEQSSNILIILVIAGLINAIAYPSIIALQGIGKPHIPAFFHIIETIFYIPLSYMLIYRFGGVGAALAWLFRVSLDTILLLTASCAALEVNPLLWCYSFVYRGFLPTVSCALLLWVLSAFHLPLLDPLNITGILFILFIYSYMVWKWGLDSIARNKILEFLKNSLK